jgi:O-antigen ligase
MRLWTVNRAVTRAALIAPLACLAALPLFSLAATGVGLMARLVVLGLFVLAVARPEGVLLVCAGLSSIGRPMGTVLGTPFGLGEPLILAFISGWLVHEALRVRRAEPAAPAVIPALLFAATVAVSCTVPLLHFPSTAGRPLLSIPDVWTFVTREYFTDHSRLRTITTGMLLLEGAGVFVAVVTLARRTHALAVQVARMAVTCAAGVALINLVRLFMVSLRGGMPIADLTLGQTPIRISYVFPDVNAAGSYFAMMLLLAGGLFVTDRRLRPVWGTALAVMAGALWLSGSRTALASVPLAVACALGLDWIRTRSVRRLVTAASIVLLLLGAIVARSNALLDRSRTLSTAWFVRVEMGRTALRMFGTHPVFGVGVGRFYTLSAEYSSTEIKRLYPRENAHNNFLQILAELGLVGLTTFVWLLWEVAYSVWRALRVGGLSPPALGAAGGLTAFLATCLAGHPLLTNEVSYAFWLVLGLAAALTPEPPAGVRAGPRKLGRSTVAAALALILALSLPVRGWQLATKSNVGGLLQGLSDTLVDEQGAPFRWMGERAQLLVPADARSVTLPLKLDPKARVETATVEICLDGLLVSRIVLAGREWHDVRFLVPPAPRETTYRRIQLRRLPPADEVPAGEGDASAPRRIQVGRPRLTGPPS